MIKNDRYLPRLVDSIVDETLAVIGAVHLNGPKCCGKTWTSKHNCNSFYQLDQPDGNYNNLKLAKADLGYALNGDYPRLIDEWQLLPAVWDAVRNSVDDKGHKGIFILSGSSTPKEESRPFHSGLGRIATVHMRTMSLFESKNSDGTVSLKGLFDGNFANTHMTQIQNGQNLNDFSIAYAGPARLLHLFARKHSFFDEIFVTST